MQFIKGDYPPVYPWQVPNLLTNLVLGGSIWRTKVRWAAPVKCSGQVHTLERRGAGLCKMACKVQRSRREWSEKCFSADSEKLPGYLISCE